MGVHDCTQDRSLITHRGIRFDLLRQTGAADGDLTDSDGFLQEADTNVHDFD